MKAGDLVASSLSALRILQSLALLLPKLQIPELLVNLGNRFLQIRDVLRETCDQSLRLPRYKLLLVDRGSSGLCSSHAINVGQSQGWCCDYCVRCVRSLGQQEEVIVNHGRVRFREFGSHLRVPSDWVARSFLSAC